MFTRHRSKIKIHSRVLRASYRLGIGCLLCVILGGTSSAVPGAAVPPEVCHFTTPGPLNGELWLIQGHHFVPGRTQVLHYLVPGDRPDPKMTNEWLQDVGKAQALPATPPEGSRPLEIVDATPDTLVVRGVRSGSPLFIFWVRTPAGLSAPQLANRPEPYWAGRSQMTPGDTGMIFGKTCCVEYRFGLVALKSRETGMVRLAELLEPGNNRTGGIVPFRIPEDVPPGLYDLWLHNGSGGKWGWGGPLPVEVTTPPTPAVIVDAREYEAKGDGVADDTQPLQRALDAAGEAARKAGPNGRATVALAPGTYNISATLTVPSWVSLRGSGSENCILRGIGYEPGSPRDSRPSQVAKPAAVVQLVSHAGLLDLTVTGQTMKGVGDGSVQIQESQWMDPVIGASIRR